MLTAVAVVAAVAAVAAGDLDVSALVLFIVARDRRGHVPRWSFLGSGTSTLETQGWAGRFGRTHVELRDHLCECWSVVGGARAHMLCRAY